MYAIRSYYVDVLKFQPLLVKPNIHELEEFFQEKITTLEEIIFYGKKLLNLGAKNVIVSRGKDGSVFLNVITSYSIHYTKLYETWLLVVCVDVLLAVLLLFVEMFWSLQPVINNRTKAIADFFMVSWL